MVLTEAWCVGGWLEAAGAVAPGALAESAAPIATTADMILRLLDGNMMRDAITERHVLLTIR
jgi:hypothetical protein